jgi:peptidoglycan/LPS O-acetylase OafA/YrhL
LSLEEQYYFVLPVTLVFVARRRWFLVGVAGVVCSLALYVFAVQRHPTAAFYSLPTRAWELGIGSLGALVATRDVVRRACRPLVWIAIIALVVVPLIPPSNSSVVFAAVSVCLATVVIILANDPGLNDNVATRAFARAGDFSYSLYLVHWPIFAFANNSWAGDNPLLPLAWRWTLLALACVLGYASYRWIEIPTRQSTAPGDDARRVVHARRARGRPHALDFEPDQLSRAPQTEFRSGGTL